MSLNFKSSIAFTSPEIESQTGCQKLMKKLDRLKYKTVKYLQEMPDKRQIDHGILNPEYFVWVAMGWETNHADVVTGSSFRKNILHILIVVLSIKQH
jgi:hypothetical protein